MRSNVQWRYGKQVQNEMRMGRGTIGNEEEGKTRRKMQKEKGNEKEKVKRGR